MTRAVDVVKQLCPHALPDYVAAFEAGDALIEGAGITTPRRLAHFLAQVFHETGDLTITFENMHYTHVERIAEVWPKRPEALKFVNDPEGLANCVYANRMGNGDATSGDGFRFRGGGLMQTTGREDYAKYGQLCGADFVNHPELIVTAAYALQPALAEWTAKGCNALADADDYMEICRRINGGYEGIADRKAELARVSAVVGDHVDFAVHRQAAAGAGAAVVAAGAVAASEGVSPALIISIAIICLVAIGVGWLVVHNRRLG